MDRPEDISANVAEKRGRPSRFPPELVAIVRRLFPEARSDRGRRNYCYLIQAVHALRSGESPEEFSWLHNEETQRNVILYSLGRQRWDDESVRHVARAICRERMRTREALEFIELVKAIAAQDNDATQVDDGDRP
jgi:SRSO17 transposase